MEKLTIVFFTIAILIFIALFIKSENDWHEFSKQHCQIIKKVSGDIVPIQGFDSKGNVTFGFATTPDKIFWKCDDGKIYVR